MDLDKEQLKPLQAVTRELARRCAICFEERRVIAKVGPFLIKEPCKNGCAGGYVRKVRP